MWSVGWCYLLFWFPLITVNGRAPVAIGAALVGIPLLVGLAAAAPVRQARWWLSWTPVAAASVALIEGGGWLAGLPGGDLRALSTIVALLGGGAYAYGMAHWLGAARWSPVTEWFHDAGRALFGAGLATAVVLVVVVTFGAPAPTVKDRVSFGMSLDGTFGRALDTNASPAMLVVGFLVPIAIAVAMVFAFYRLHQANAGAGKALEPMTTLAPGFDQPVGAEAERTA